MTKTYIILGIVLIAIAGGLVLLPESKRTDEIKPEMLFKEINDQARYLSVDHVAERLINEDPSIMLIDVRPADQYQSYSLPNALCIPLDEILLPEWKDYLNQDEMDIVFFSNGDVYADQAWVLCARLGYKNLYVLSGGLNKWFADIMQATPPPETAPSEEFDIYAFRLAAKYHFGGGSLEATPKETKNDEVPLIKRKKKTVSEGGC
ncbi:MAG: rhodanese-like domain-containing protein [Bacteroidales bacterium]|nr:rhodanese-like domain-containing protein [Bacteroidales bacterium]MCF8402615.1 rhodanese-like domain-containing protein [Bacteroidales bacterium]